MSSFNKIIIMRYQYIIGIVLLLCSVTSTIAQDRKTFKDSLRNKEVKHFADTLSLSKAQANALSQHYVNRDRQTDSVMRLPLIGQDGAKRKAMLQEVRTAFNEAVKQTLNKKQYQVFKEVHKAQQALAMEKLKGLKKQILVDNNDKDN